MAGSIVRRHLNKNFELSGVFASAAAYLVFLNKQSAEEGMLYFDTTENRLKTYDGTSWSAAGINSTSAGSLDDAANIGTKITIDGALTSGIEIEATDTFISSNGALLLLDNNDTNTDIHALEITSTSTAPAIQITNDTATTDDIQGTSDSWAITGQGAAALASVTLADDNPVNFGAATDSVLQWDQTRLALTAAADSTFRIGAAAFSYDVEFIGNTAVTNLMKWDLDGGVNSVGALIFDNADIDMGDNDVIRFGDVADITVTWDSNKLVFSGQAANNAIHIGDATNLDLKIFGDSTNDSVLFDTSEEDVRFNGFDLTILDDDLINFGDGDDVSITWDQTNLLIEADSDNTGQIRLGSTNSMDLSIYGSTSTKIALFDVSGALLDLEGWSIRIRDDDRVRFGDSADGSSADADILWDQTKLVINSYGSSVQINDDVVIGTSGTDEENLTVNGNLTVTGTFSLAGSFNPTSLLLTDDETLGFGTDSDITMVWDQTQLVFSGAANNSAIHIGDATNLDFIIFGDTTTDAVTFDTSEELCTFNGFDLYMDDDDVIAFGDAQDITMTWDQTQLTFSGAADNNAIHIGDETNLDLVIFGDTTTDAITFDTSEEDVRFNGFDLTMLDDDKINFGNADDVIVQWDQSELAIDGIASNTGIVFGKNTTVDVEFTGGSADSQWDANRDMLLFNDDAIVGFGGSQDSTADVTFTWDAVELAIDGVAANTGIVFGKTTTVDVEFTGAAKDIQWDASLNLFKFNDDAILGFGGTKDGAADATISWDQTELAIDAAAANGTISIGKTTDTDFTFHGTTADVDVEWNSSANMLHVLDNAIVGFGGAADGTADFTIAHDSTNTVLVFSGGAANTAIHIGDETNLDLVIFGDTTTDAVTFDTSEETCTFNGFDLLVFDDDIVSFGDDQDITITWDSTNNDLLIDGNAVDTEIKIGKTNNQDLIIYGDSTNQSVAFDTSAELVTFTDFDLTMSGTTDAVITCAVQDDLGGLAIPTSDASPVAQAPATGSIFFEGDQTKLWVHIGGGTWVGTVLS